MTHDDSLSRRELLGGLGLLAAGCTNSLYAQTTEPAKPADQPPRDSGMTHVAIAADNPALVRDRSKCTRCGQCLHYCYRYCTVHGHRSSEGRQSCTYCGQCTIQCETQSITERSEIAEYGVSGLLLLHYRLRNKGNASV